MRDRINQLIQKAQPALNRLYEIRLFVFILAFIGIYSFLVIRVNRLIQHEPPATSVDAASQSIRRLTIDKVALEKIKQLQSQNIQVQSLFEQARNNPFKEE